jgi:hypothetical protein
MRNTSLLYSVLKVTDPLSNSNLTAGDIQTVTWEDNGASPSLLQFGASRIELVTVVDLEDPLDTLPGTVQVIAENLDVSTVGSITFRPNPNVGWNGKNLYVGYNSLIATFNTRIAPTSIIAFQSLSLKNPKNLSQPALGFSALFAWVPGLSSMDSGAYRLCRMHGMAADAMDSFNFGGINGTETISR